jgi:hypothetical protein
MAPGLLDFVDPIVGHAVFRDRLDQAKIGLTAAPRAAESFGAIVDIVETGEVQTRVAPADVAAQPHLPVGLGECAKGEGAMRPGSNQGTGARGRRQLVTNQLSACSVSARRCRAPKVTRDLCEESSADSNSFA